MLSRGPSSRAASARSTTSSPRCARPPAARRSQGHPRDLRARRPRPRRRAAWIACEAGSRLRRTSTGKGARSADPATALCLLRVADEYARATGRPVGVKVAGGMRTTRDALAYLALLLDRCGPSWLTPRRFRFGASSLCGALVRSHAEVAAEARP
ncbi:MAG: hypothetical protein R3F30_12915 [Planctomycetota bacterium]